ncbi:MAG: hypothetical protein U0168_18420 [Nannocystaceae bacterium]
MPSAHQLVDRRPGAIHMRTHDDENLSRCTGALDAESLLPGERETAAAMQLVALRQQYWRRLLAPLPLRAAMVEAITAAQARLRGEVALAPLRAWARRHAVVDPGGATRRCSSNGLRRLQLRARRSPRRRRARARGRWPLLRRSPARRGRCRRARARLLQACTAAARPSPPPATRSRAPTCGWW